MRDNVVFKRRDKLTPLNVIGRLLWPKGGWGRAARYMRHRLHRLPDTPRKIARGVFAGVFIVFTPFFGLHFLFAFVLAKLMRGNIFAALIATFIGNPLTYVPIAIVSLKTGHFVLGTQFTQDQERSFVGKFYDAGRDILSNFRTLFSDDQAQWQGLMRFAQEAFLPYLVGGILPGVVAGLAGYYVTLPMVSAYQHHRKGLLKQKLDELREKSKNRHDDQS